MSSIQGSRQRIGATVEALKDNGFFRGNDAMRSVYSHAKNNESKSFAISVLSNGKLMTEIESIRKAKQAEESLRTVMYLSCWGPN